MGFFNKIKQGLTKTHTVIAEKLDAVVRAFRPVDEDLLEELEEALISSDLGVETSLEAVERLRAEVRSGRLREADEVRGALIGILSEMVGGKNPDAYTLKLNTRPSVILVIGVNGAGKTTTIGKLAHTLKSSGKSVLLAAGDTFRAAAADQLEVWAKRTGTDLIRHGEGADAAAVIFDAVNAAKARKTDVLICDTAGRLHNKQNLMNELKKLVRVIERELPEARIETYLVLDATTGQNAVVQAKSFDEVTSLSGIILTKLDGTAKGGIVISIARDLSVPVRYIGVGEGLNDLTEFDAGTFVEALF